MITLKILCIDGGGIRGVFAIAILQAIEEEYNQRIGNYFDLIAGTSTGAIIAASAALNTDMDEVLDSYITYGKKIFIRKAKFGLFKSIYSDRYLKMLLKDAFGELEIANVPKPLILPAVDVTRGKPFVHRSNGLGGRDDTSVKLWDAVLSSCSAPIYFPPNNVENKYLSIDGGLWANNPSLVCLTEAMHFYDEKLETINILSLGTGKQNIDFSNDGEKYWGINHWLPFQFPSLKVTPKLLDLALDLSSESVSYHCDLLLRKNYVRINKELGEEMPFDEVDFIDKLIQLGREAFKENKDNIVRFLEKE